MDQTSTASIHPEGLVDSVADAINECDHSLKVMSWEERLLAYARAAIDAVRAWDEEADR